MRNKKLIGLICTIAVLAMSIASFLIYETSQVVVEAKGKLSISLTNSEPQVSVGELVNPTNSKPQTLAEDLVEQVWMRTKNSKVFHSYTIHRDYHDIYLGAIHYEVGYDREIETLTGYETVYWTTWEDIDTTLEPAGELSPWDWQMVKAGYHTYILEDFTYGQILKFEKTDPHGAFWGDVAFQPMALQWTNDLDQIQEVSMPQSGNLSVADNKIKWDDAYGLDIDFEWRCSSTKLLKLLTISSLSDLPIPESYIIDGGNPVLELNFIFDPSSELDIYVDGGLWDEKSDIQTFGIVEFKSVGETLWGFMPLWVWDSSGEDEVSVAQRLRKVGNKLYVSVRVPYEWIQSADFPIYIDAIVDEQVKASSDDADEVVSDGSVDLTNTIIDFGSYTGGPTHAGFRFTNIDTTDVEDVQVAYLEFYPVEDDSGAVSYTWYGEGIASAPTFTTSAYNISGRDRTIASVTENPPAVWVGGTWIQTTDLSDILNEVFSRGDWVSDNDLAILGIYDSGNGERRLRSWDYDDHSKAPKLHFENPTEVTYYWDVKSAADNWETSPEYMIDGILTNYASTAIDGTYQRLLSTTCDGTDLGTITKVEIRFYGYGDGDDRIDFSFGAFPTTPEYQTIPTATEDWTVYVDVTGDSNVAGWTWAKVADLYAEMTKGCNVEFDKVGKGNTMYCAKVEIRVTYDACSPDISNTPAGKDFGVVSANTSYWSKGSAPTFPLDDSECQFTVTNNSGGTIDITVKGTNFTGGNGWTLVASPASDNVTIKAGKSGDANEGAMVTLTTSAQAFIGSLADSGTKKWEIKMETPTEYTDGVGKTSTITLEATCQ